MSCVDSVPSLSPTVTKIIQVANNPNASADELIQVIKLDPVLTGKVIKMINSVYYGMQQKVVSLGRAVILLGINTIKNLALSTAIVGNFKRKGRIGQFDMNAFWEHCLGCAVGSKLLAKSKNIDKLLWEEYFIAGLLHDIGKLALAQFAPEEYAEVFEVLQREPEKGEVAVEELILGTNHARIGGLIAEKWKLPEVLVNSILEHHGPAVSEQGFCIKTAVYIANIHCHRKKFADSSSNSQEYDPRILKAVGLTEEKLEDILTPLENDIQLARSFLEMS